MAFPGGNRHKQRLYKALMLTMTMGFSLVQPRLCADVPDFRKGVQPILNEHCAECHGGVKKSSGFSVLSRERMLERADSGLPGLLPGNAKQSSLVQRIRDTDMDNRMPPEGHEPLSSDQIGVLMDWIDAGASWPQHWAFAPLRQVQIPSGKHPVDFLVQSALAKRGLAPSSPALPSTLLRRLSLDLTGLLPESAVMKSFTGNPTDIQLESLVDRLLASPHFGERWARHWLDEARYADSLGYEKDSVKEDAWQYRDWVVDAMNRDVPFDVFSQYQLAGDLMPEHWPEGLLATKLHLQTQFNLEGGIDAEEDRVKRVVDRVNMVGATWLGLTIGCAQCHDHPYDPISQNDFYAFYALFNNLDETGSFLHSKPGNAQALEKERAIMQGKMETILRKQIDDKNLNNEAVGHLVKLFQFDNRNKMTRHMLERRTEQRATFLFKRGDFLRPDLKRGAIEPGLPSLFAGSNVSNRLELASWLFTRDNPLTARVLVNKVWMHLMGRPLVDSVQNFGAQGTEASHPELLDWLAGWWMNEGQWSLKRLVRLMVLSETYRQSSLHRPELSELDIGNRWFGRQNRFRHEAELIRDTSLQVAGLLSGRVGGPSAFPPMPQFLLKQSYTTYGRKSEGATRYRRGLYTFFRRTAMDPNLTVFDCPDASISTATRGRSNNALQAMATLNNEVFVEAAKGFSYRLLALDTELSDAQRMHEAFVMALMRPVDNHESALMLQMLKQAREWYGSHSEEALAMADLLQPEGITVQEHASWTTVTRLILNLDEFLTRE
jgi:hypothetical protein